MRRNPSGKIWTFDENLGAHSENDILTENESADCDTPSEHVSTGSSLKNLTRKKRHNDGKILQLAFPGARCIAIHGIWDTIRRRWSVGGLFWTYDPLRILCADTEMQFVAAFCEVVTAETKRLEAVGSDKAKSDFISSVSHELRSPLHGILGSVEVLADHKLDSTASTLVEQITSCGHTLLEIIDHLLDFANLKEQRLKKGMVKSSRIGRRIPPSTLGAFENDLTAFDMNVVLDDVTEDVVVSSVYSFYYNHDATGNIRTSVILEIDRSEGTAWRCQLATGGWKRICMNLVTNALKYTPVGFTRVSLKQKSRPGPRRRFDAVLSVTDCGIGMSEEFQKNHLFRDFSQENTQSSGLGIGMHMVARMVRAMGGKIEVTSDQKGMGTCVTVNIPVEDHQDRNKLGGEGSTSASKAFEGLQVGIITEAHLPPETREGRLMSTARVMAIASIKKNLKYLGMCPEDSLCRDYDSHDLKVVTEIDLTSYLQAVQQANSRSSQTNFTPVLVICNNELSAQIFRKSWSKNPVGAKLAVEYIALPCGAKQIARATESALKLHKELLKSFTARLQSIDALSATVISSKNKSSQDSPSPTRLPTPASTLLSFVSTVSRTTSNELHVSMSPAQNTQSPQEQLLPASRTSIEVPRSRTSMLHVPGIQEPDTPASTDSLVPADASMSRSPILLLVDDNRINLQLLTMFAKKRGYPYVTAVDGKLAVGAFVKAHKESLFSSEIDAPVATERLSSVGIPNVILMDINMPVMDGYEAVQRIRTYEAKHNVVPARIIAVTALQSEAAHVEAVGSGFNMFLNKPLQLKSLVKIIEGG
jgi:signal transduction histidine kinase/CheY-like chemotaxis protein